MITFLYGFNLASIAAINKSCWRYLDQPRGRVTIGTLYLAAVGCPLRQSLRNPLAQRHVLRPCPERGLPFARTQIIVRETSIFLLEPSPLQADDVSHPVQLVDVAVAPHVAPRPAGVLADVIYVDGHGVGSINGRST